MLIFDCRLLIEELLVCNQQSEIVNQQFSEADESHRDPGCLRHMSGSA
jgi:hypothetical protein